MKSFSLLPALALSFLSLSSASVLEAGNKKAKHETTANPLEVTFVTGNMNKVREVQKALEGTSLSVVNEKKDLVEIQGSALEIVRHKARLAAFTLKKSVLVEDTSLSFDAFSSGSPHASVSIPGPYIKWFLEPKKKYRGADAAAQDAYKKEMNERLCRMTDGFGHDGRGATATCIFAVCLEAPQDMDGVHGEAGDDVKCFIGEVKGTISESPRGSMDFGWDCVFIPEGEEQTFAELPEVKKIAISHRTRALRLLQEEFTSQ